MFDINDLMSPKVREQFDNLSHIRSQAVFFSASFGLYAILSR